MKILVSILLVGACLSFTTPAGAKTHVLSAAEAKELETNYNKLTPGREPAKLQRDQAFEIDLNSSSLKKVVFAPFERGGVEFVLLSTRGKSILKTLPKSELAVVNIFAFTKVDAVSFKDVNGDGTKDIFVLTSYFDSRPVQGEGVGGGTIKIGYAFVSQKDDFTLIADCGEDTVSLQNLEKCVKKSVKK